MNADGWRGILISDNFENVREDFRKSIVEMAKRLCQERSANYFAVFLACRLIPLDKQPGVRPIGIGEVLRRVIGKIEMKLLRKDILNAYNFVLVKTPEVKRQFTQFMIFSMMMTLKRF